MIEGVIAEAAFKPIARPIKFFTTGAVSIKAVACLDCGSVLLHTRPEDLIAMVGEPPLEEKPNASGD